jgi:hypothetical protein
MGMRRRCLNPLDPAWHAYGGRGITICDAWAKSFPAFYADMGARPSMRHTIDRIDNDRGYEPGNCRWATMAEQNTNRRDIRWIAFAGRSMPITHWARELGVDAKTLDRRLAKGMSLDAAMSSTKYLKRRELDLDGRAQSIPEWSRELGVKENTLWGRVLKGWADRDVLLVPIGGRPTLPRKVNWREDD